MWVTRVLEAACGVNMTADKTEGANVRRVYMRFWCRCLRGKGNGDSLDASSGAGVNTITATGRVEGQI